MFNTKLKKLSGLMLLSASLTLTGCDWFESDSGGGDDDDIPYAVVSGSALKGLLIGADVNFYHHSDLTNSAFSTTTDSEGNYNLEAPTEDFGIYVVRVTANGDTTMICDALDCGVDAAGVLIGFGGTVPANLLTGVELSNLIFVDELSIPQTAQVNAITSVATEVFIETVISDENFDPAAVTVDGFSNIQESVSTTVAVMFGVDVTAGTNVFELTLPNPNDSTELAAATSAEAGFAMINSAIATSSGESIAASVDAVVETASTLVNSDTTESDQAWLDTQAALLAETVALVNSDAVTIPADVATELEDAANDGANLGEIDQAIEDGKEVSPTGGTGGTTAG
ncbi:hypothetical protein AADZ86_02710 [Colwelliaceae bacterium BS250]